MLMLSEVFAALQYLPTLIDVAIKAYEGVEGLIAAIKASSAPPEAQAALIALVRSHLADEAAKVAATPLP